VPQAERDYSHRDVVDKLGIRPGDALAFDRAPLPVDADLRARALAKAGRDEAADDEPVDVVLIGADASTHVEEVLERWRTRIDPAGGIWLLTPKRGQPGYVDQRELILAGPAVTMTTPGRPVRRPETSAAMAALFSCLTVIGRISGASASASKR